MKVKLLIVGTALTGLLVALNQFTFGQSEETLPEVPVSAGASPSSAPDMDSASAMAAPEVDQIELSPQVDMAGMEVAEGDTGQDLITISLDNAPLADVVRMFSRISGANIVAGTNLQGAVTVSMHDVPWEPALSAILDSVNLVLVEKTDGIFTIISKADLAAEPVTMETIFLSYTQVTNVLPVVQRMLVSTNATASAFPSANAIVVQETAARLSAIRTTVKKIDKPRPQVYIEAKFIELNDSAIETLGINWQVLQGYTISAAPSYLYSDERTSTDTYTDQLANSRENTRLRRNTSLSNSERNDVLYNSTASVSLPQGTASGTINGRNALPTLTVQEGGSIFQPAISTLELEDVVPARGLTATSEGFSETIDSLASTFSSVTDSIDTRDVTKLFGAVLSADELAVTLSALKEEDGIEVVSNPKIIVANGETANIHVGRNEPNVTAVPTGDTGDRFAVTLDQNQPYIEIGVKLEVTPTVNTEDFITVDIVPELSRKIGDLEVGGIGVSYPITSVRKIQTEFQLKSGKTVAIGGLTETSDSVAVNKIPVLGDIPVIGKYLFTHRETKQVQDETIIFVTVGLANPDSLVEISGIPSGGELVHRYLANQAAQEVGDMVE